MDRRAHVRHPIYIEAVLASDSGLSGACRIRDFCPGGMFLSLDNVARDDRGALTTSRFEPHDRLQVRFAVNIDGAPRRFSVAAQVARRLTSGLGVAFEQPDPSTLRILQQLAAARRERMLSGTSARQQVLAILTKETRTMLAATLPGFFRQAEDDLMTAARSAQGAVDQARAFSAMTDLRQRSGRMQQDIATAVIAAIERFWSGSAPSSRDDSAVAEGTRGLQLVDKQDFEEFLVAADVVSRLEAAHKQALLELAQRLSYAIQAEVDNASNPVGPAAFAAAVRDALEPLPIRPGERSIVYRSFEAVFDAALTRFLVVLNAALKDAGVLPTLDPQVALPMRAEPSPAVTTRARAADPVVQQASPPAAPIGATSGVTDRASAPTAVPGRAVPAAVAAPVAAPGTPAGASESRSAVPAGIAPGQPQPVLLDGSAALLAPRMQRAFSAAQTLLHLTRRAASAPAAAAEAALPALSLPVDRDELVDLLSTWQRDAAAGAMLPGIEPGGAVAPALKSALGASSQIESHDGDVLEFVDGLVSAMLDDETLTATARDALRRLSLPLHKVALLEPEFLTAEDHPARQVVNQIAALPGGGDDASAEALRSAVGRIVDRILGKYGRDGRVFAGALGELQRLAREQSGLYDENVHRLVRACEEQQSLVLARRKAEGGDTVNRAQARPLPEEWLQWLARARRLVPGDRVVFQPGTPQARQATLAWTGAEYNPFVFVDERGAKAAVLNLQELAMQLRRGSAQLLGNADLPLVDRALFRTLGRMQAQVEQDAASDTVTGLPGRRVLESEIQQAPAAAAGAVRTLIWARSQSLATVAGDYGREAGEQLLRGTADQLRGFWGDARMVARAGAADFAILVDAPSASVHARARECARLLAGAAISWAGQPLCATWGLGGTEIPASGEDPGEALRTAAEAAQRALDTPERVVMIDAPRDSVAAGTRDHMSTVEAQLARGVLALRAQRMAPTRVDDPAVLCELALAIEGETVTDAVLASVVESTGRASACDRAAINAALLWIADHGAVEQHRGLYLVPLSRQSLADSRFIDYVTDCLMASHVPPGRICFVIADPSVFDPLSDARAFVRAAGEFGCRFALAGFGSVSSGYEQLRDLPVDLLVVAENYIANLAAGEAGATLLKSINEIAHFMGKRTVARAVASREILDRVRDVGVDYAIGPAVESPRYLGEVRIDVAASG